MLSSSISEYLEELVSICHSSSRYFPFPLSYSFSYAFTPTLNDQLSLLFLDLPSGCQIISLKPFVPHDFRLTQRNHGSVQAILSVQERQYGTGMVSWAERGGKYYIAKVDRDLVREFLEKRGSHW